MLSDNKEIAKSFNKFYIQVTKKNSINKLTNTYRASLVLRQTTFDNITETNVIPVSDAEVKNVFLKPKNSTKYDGISNKF
jgi:hypothetical protein